MRCAAGSAIADLGSYALMGTVVRAGTGAGVVVGTAGHTEFGRITLGLGERPPETAFQVGLRRFSVLPQVALVLTVAIFVINLVLHRPLPDAALLSLAIATPGSNPRTTLDEEPVMTDPTHETTHRIVVGIDGSAGSKHALAWAMAQAHLTGATVEAVTSWQDPIVYGYAYGFPQGAYDGESFSSIMTKVLNDTISEVTTDVATAGVATPVTVMPRTLEGHAAQVLLHAAKGAQLLVVGSRGHGTFAGILLGSVSQHCVQHAPCPVVVVPDPTP